MLMLPEIIVIATAFIVLLSDLFLSDKSKPLLTHIALAGTALAMFYLVAIVPIRGEMLGGRFIQDSMSWWFKIIFLLAGFLTIAVSSDMLNGKSKVDSRGFHAPGEFLTLILFSLVGMMFLSSSSDLITLYVSLELTTIPLFILSAWRKDCRLSGEAGIKYVVLGALSSAALLYGLGIFYGLAGTTHLVDIGSRISISPTFWLASSVVFIAIGFKLAVVPFHLWAADIYEGAPTPVTAYLSVASKGAGLAFMFQLVYRVMGNNLADYGLMIAVLSAATMTLGNVVAIVQNNIKRFMAFSSISQAGYLLMGFLDGVPEGVPAMLFYMLVYVVSNMAVFAVIMAHSNATGKEEIKDYRGLSRTNPVMSVVMLLALFSLAGIPPLAGFTGKFFLFVVAANTGYYWLVGLAAVNSTISLFYYLRIVREMYIEPLPDGASRLPVSPIIKFSLGLTCCGILLLGVIPHFFESIHTQTGSWVAILSNSLTH